jgi:hypothetical protein
MGIYFGGRSWHREVFVFFSWRFGRRALIDAGRVNKMVDSVAHRGAGQAEVGSGIGIDEAVIWDMEDLHH